MSTDTNTDGYDVGQIHDNLGGPKEFKYGITANDLAIMATPSALVLVLLGMPFIPASFTFPILGLSLAFIPVMGAFYKAKPNHLTLAESLTTKIRWVVKEKEYKLGTDGFDDSLNATRVDEVQDGAIRRTDGALVGALRVDPANMALETEDAWAQAVGSFSNFANNSLEFKTQIYITGREINTEQHLGPLRERLSDSYVRSHPVMEALIERFIGWYSGRVEAQGTHTREYYIIVPVTDKDIQHPEETTDSVLSELDGMPIIGRIAGIFGATSEGLTDAQKERLKKQKLDNRLDQVRSGASNIRGCQATPVDSYEFARALKEFWAGERQEYGDIKSAIGGLPVIDQTDDGSFTFNGRSYPDKEADIRASVDAELADFVDPEDESDHAEEKRGTVAKSKLESLDYDIRKNQKSFFAPASIDWETDHAVVDGEKYMRTYWVEEFPENPIDGFLERILLEADLGTDISIHLNPFDTQSALDALSDWISSMEVTYRELDENGEIRAEDYQEDIQRAKEMRAAVRSNQTSLFRGGVYLRVTADSVEELRQQSREVESLLRDVPANTTPKVATKWQEKGLHTMSPLGLNRLGDNRMAAMTGRAVGSMFPFSSNYYMDDNGIEYGVHGHNGTPVLIDPFSLDTGANELVAGDIGSGKTVTVKKNITRTLQQRDDVRVVMLDPVQGFEGMVDAFGGDTVLVGGQTKVNPMHIEKTPKRVLNNANGELDPLAAKKDEVMSFLDNFFAMEGFTLDNKRGVLRYAISETYERAKITENVQTHTRDSPTILDLISVLGDIAENPEAHDIVSSQSGNASVVDAANDIEIALQAFKQGGVYHNLAQPSDVDILSENADDPMVYIDLQQEDGRGEGNKGFMMQLLLSTVYQQAKKIDDKVVFAIDEAHYLLQDKENLDYIQQIIRHSRHVDMRMILASQTLAEFYKTDDAKAIANQCSIKVLHKLNGLEKDLAEHLDLSAEQQQFVRSAAAGEESRGYSEALVQVKGRGEYPVQVQLNDLELELVAHKTDPKTLLGALAETDEDREEFRSFLESDGAVRTLFEYYDLPHEQARRLVEEGVTYQQLVDALIDLVTDLPEDQTSLAEWGSDEEESSDEEQEDHWSETEYWAGREESDN